MTKEEKLIAEKRATEMVGWTRQAWASFFRKYAADEAATARHKVDYAALKSYMFTSSESILEADSHRAILTTSRGAAYIDWDGVCADLAAMGIDVDTLTTKWTRRRADTSCVRFKQSTRARDYGPFNQKICCPVAIIPGGRTKMITPTTTPIKWTQHFWITGSNENLYAVKGSLREAYRVAYRDLRILARLGRGGIPFVAITRCKVGDVPAAVWVLKDTERGVTFRKVF